MRRAFFTITIGCLAVLLHAASVSGQPFSGGGASIYVGTGFPNSIDAASELAGDLGFTDEVGNLVVGLQGFYQGDRYRLGAAFQALGWGGVNTGTQKANEGAAGVVAGVAGLYATRTIRHDRFLLNVGGVLGGGRALLGFTEEDGSAEEYERVAVFYIEPLISAGVAATSWFGVEFQLSAPLFVLADDLEFTYGGRAYRASGRDMNGASFMVKLTFGKIANP
jgi:hypothetical protein